MLAEFQDIQVRRPRGVRQPHIALGAFPEPFHRPPRPNIRRTIQASSRTLEISKSDSAFWETIDATINYSSKPTTTPHPNVPWERSVRSFGRAGPKLVLLLKLTIPKTSLVRNCPRKRRTLTLTAPCTNTLTRTAPAGSGVVRLNPTLGAFALFVQCTQDW